MSLCRAVSAPGGIYCERHTPGAAKQPAVTSAAAAPNLDTRLVCPHCGQTGTVRARDVKVKRGISGGKATGAVLTAGVSLIATGLSRKVKASERTCRNCGTTWLV